MDDAVDRRTGSASAGRAADHARADRGTGPPGPRVHTHRDVTGGWLRPAVFGAMDGLVSNSALLAGVEGGIGGRSTIILAGLAGLFAGAFSMAVGEYSSVASQGELALAEIATERREIVDNADGEEAELAQLYIERGVDPDLAREVARQLHRDVDTALGIHVREELGVRADQLPSPLLAGLSSLAAFSTGALIPVLPFLLGASVVWPAIVATLLALFVAGALVSKVTARAWWYSGLRQLVLGAAAGALTFALGAAVGAGLG